MCHGDGRGEWPVPRARGGDVPYAGPPCPAGAGHACGPDSGS